MRFVFTALMVLVCTTTAYTSTNTSIDHKLLTPTKRISVTITAYTPDPRENGGPGTKSGTAIGTPIRPGIVAVSRDLLHSGWDFGDKVHIKGLGTFIIEDTMHQRFRRTIDIAVRNMAEAQRIGKMTHIEVTLLEHQPESDG